MTEPVTPKHVNYSVYSDPASDHAADSFGAGCLRPFRGMTAPELLSVLESWEHVEWLWPWSADIRLIRQEFTRHFALIHGRVFVAGQSGNVSIEVRE